MHIPHLSIYRFSAAAVHLLFNYFCAPCTNSRFECVFYVKMPKIHEVFHSLWKRLWKVLRFRMKSEFSTGKTTRNCGKLYGNPIIHSVGKRLKIENTIFLKNILTKKSLINYAFLSKTDFPIGKCQKEKKRHESYPNGPGVVSRPHVKLMPAKTVYAKNALLYTTHFHFFNRNSGAAYSALFDAPESARTPH